MLNEDVDKLPSGARIPSIKVYFSCRVYPPLDKSVGKYS